MIALKSSIPFLQKTVDTTTTGEKSLSGSGVSPRLGVLTAVNYKRATFRFSLQGAGALVGNVTIEAAGNILASREVNGDTEASLEFDAHGVQGQSEIVAKLEVTTAGDASCVFSGVIDVEQPILTSGC